MRESFKERRARWERAIENVFIEMSKEKDCNGLTIYVNTAGIINEFNSEVVNIETTLSQCKRNCGVANLVPGNRLNEE